MVRLSSWGRLTDLEHNIEFLYDRTQVVNQIQNTKNGLAHGMGRSYGDVCLNPGETIWLTKGLDRFISFDEMTGQLICESGILLRDIQRLTLPRGWLLAVSPGTQMITVGGAIANDVHGKNYHSYGSFGNHIKQITLVRTDGQVILCSRDLNPEWFYATIGGLGLTGVIIEVKIQLRRVDGPWLITETIPYTNLDEFFQLSDESERSWEYIVSWIDCLSSKGGNRGIFLRAKPSHLKYGPNPQEKMRSIPFTPFFSLINHITLRPFNSAYYAIKTWRSRKSISHYESYLYPLDHLNHWNRMYGTKGFFQYQSVMPRNGGDQAIQKILEEVRRENDGSFLAVLKNFSHFQSLGMMSFPKKGITLALDFPNRGQKTEKLFERLDEIVRAFEGRIYPAKDARMPRDLFESGYPRLSEFLKYRDPGISSALSRRLIGD